jgi:hypothetical protein
MTSHTTTAGVGEMVGRRFKLHCADCAVARDCHPRHDCSRTVLVLTMDSAVLGLASSGCSSRTVLVFEQNVALEDAIGSHHGCSLEALACLCLWITAFLSGIHYL